MTKIAKQLTELVGNTPLLELNKYSQAKSADEQGRGESATHASSSESQGGGEGL